MRNSCAKRLFMVIAAKQSANPAPAVRVRWWLLALGVIPLIGTTLLAGRLIWEQTVWTWERGPQLVGFSLAHGSGAVLLVFPLLLIMWTVVVVVITIRNKIRKQQIASARWIALAAAVLLLAMGELPAGFWQKVFISRMAASPHSGDLLVYA